MVNWTGKARTNYFRVRNMDAFTTDLHRHNMADSIIIEPGGPNDPDGSICLIGDDESGVLPTINVWDRCDGCGHHTPDECDRVDDHECGCMCEFPPEGHGIDLHESLVELLADHLIDDDVAVFITIGSEKLRFLNGTAVAVNNKGDIRRIDLNDIYALAATLGTTVTPAEH